MTIRKKFIDSVNGVKRLDVVQHRTNGFVLSFNPDDCRYYVSDEENETLGIFRRFTNATYFYKKKINQKIEEGEKR